jgi:FkbM family methyltransferase
VGGGWVGGGGGGGGGVHKIQKCKMLFRLVFERDILRGIEKIENYVCNGALEFFSKNQKRVSEVASLLCDKKSKKIYLQMVRYRQTRKWYYYAINCGEQYFINDFFRYGKNEIFIDCGAFTGDTIEKFIALPKMEYKKIIAFETDKQNFEKLQCKFKNNPKIVLINEGVYNKNCGLYFSRVDDTATSGIVSEFPTGKADEISIKVRSIDSLQISDKVTFIKMDIEGAELNALKGAEKTILRDKPRLAICIYHSNEDMIRIAEWIHALVPEYKLYVRHHNYYPSVAETVLYAQIICDSQNG